jgi:hypothetical protein
MILILITNFNVLTSILYTRTSHILNLITLNPNPKIKKSNLFICGYECMKNIVVVFIDMYDPLETLQAHLNIFWVLFFNVPTPRVL